MDDHSPIKMHNSNGNVTSGINILWTFSRPICLARINILRTFSRPICLAGINILWTLSRPICLAGINMLWTLSRPILFGKNLYNPWSFLCRIRSMVKEEVFFYIDRHKYLNMKKLLRNVLIHLLLFTTVMCMPMKSKVTKASREATKEPKRSISDRNCMSLP